MKLYVMLISIFFFKVRWWNFFFFVFIGCGFLVILFNVGVEVILSWMFEIFKMDFDGEKSLLEEFEINVECVYIFEIIF